MTLDDETAAESTPEDAAAAETEIASGGITVALAPAEPDGPEAYVPLNPGANHVTWSDVAAAAEIAAATRRAEQAEQLAARTLTALELALQKWQEATARADAAKALAADAAKALATDALGNRDRVHACNVRIAELEAELARARRPWVRFGGAR